MPPPAFATPLPMTATKPPAAPTRPSSAALRPIPSCAKPAPSAARHPRLPRPVFLRGALSRLLRQPTWPRRLRTARLILSFVLSDAAWWLSHGLSHIPATVRAARARATLPLHPHIPAPSVDLYAPPAHDAYIRARLATVSCHASHPPAPDPRPAPPPAPVVLYVHGGAWGAGDAAHYSQLATALAARADATVLVLSYRLYPVARMEHQAADVAAALRYARRVFPNRPLVVLAHSSGAHLAALALLRAVERPTDEHHQQQSLADVLITSAAPFHLMHHFLFEAGRGIADVSPMLPAAGAETDPSEFDKCSPTCIVEALDSVLQEVDGLPPEPPGLEGELAAANVPLPPVKTRSAHGPRRRAKFPRTYIMTSSCDTIVPMYSSLRFAAALRDVGLESKLLVYDNTQHVDFVTDWFAGAQDRDLGPVLDVCDKDRERRKTYIGLLKGRLMAELADVEQKKLGPTPYVRDVIRILKGLSVSPDADDGDDIV